MLTNRDVIPHLLDAVPGLEPVWFEIEDDPLHVDSDGTRLRYIDAARIAKELVVMLQADRLEEVRRAFGVFERFLLEGVPETAELITIGYLEEIQNASLRAAVALDGWLPLMGPECRRWWLGIQALWERGQVPLMPVNSESVEVVVPASWIEKLRKRGRLR